MTPKQQRPRRTLPSVNSLERAILKAYDRDDGLFDSLIGQMIAIASGKAPGYTDADCIAALQWVAAHDGGALDDAIRRHLWQHPEILIEATKQLREWAMSPSASRRIRREAMRMLKQYGFDDEALAQEPQP